MVAVSKVEIAGGGGERWRSESWIKDGVLMMMILVMMCRKTKRLKYPSSDLHFLDLTFKINGG